MNMTLRTAAAMSIDVYKRQGIIRPGKNACQVIVGTNVKSVYDELDKLLK